MLFQIKMFAYIIFVPFFYLNVISDTINLQLNKISENQFNNQIFLNKQKLFFLKNNSYFAQLNKTENSNSQTNYIELKDIININISFVALIISILVAIDTRKRYEASEIKNDERYKESEEKYKSSQLDNKLETDRIIRLELTGILKRLIELKIKYVELMELPNVPPSYRNLIEPLLNQENTSLAYQAIYFAERIPNFVSEVDLYTIADANHNAGNLLEAKRYYEYAIDKNYFKEYIKTSGGERNDDEDVKKSKVATTRALYGAFLFSIAKESDAREEFDKAKKAIEDMKVTNLDWKSYLLGNVYIQWAIGEFRRNNIQEYEERIEQAKRSFNKIDDQKFKDKNLKIIEDLKNRLN
ncbi:hypothetical protein [Nostoc sp. CCY0012]|uniref:hypothetical protein n=1 Tax=Nostoc sp. CCY0012 TaxID=1056123 RepID=UPI0039C6BCD7